MPRAVLELRDLWVGQGPGAAVQGVSAVVGRGQVLGVLGGPGAGKSRLLRCIGLDYAPSRGAVFLRGDEISGTDPARRRQLRSGPIELVHPPAPLGTPDTTIPGGHVGLTLAARARTIPVAGMRQRIQIAKALTSGAEVLLLDEPFTGVDGAVRIRILELLERLRAEVGTAVVMATRDAGLLATLADEVVVLDDGVVVEHGPVSSVLPESAVRHTAGVDRLRSA